MVKPVLLLAAASSTFIRNNHSYLANAFTSNPPANVQPFNTLKGRECTYLSFSTIAPEDTTNGSSNTKQIAVKNPNTSTRKSPKSKKKSRNSPKKENGASKGPKERPSNNTRKTKLFKPLKDLRLGSTISGKVVDVCEFGAFVDIGYATQGSRAGTALLHISQIQDNKIENIGDVIKVGDIIEGARVITVDLAKGEVGLSLRKQRLKRKDISTFKVGQKIVGRVDTVLPYGAFIDVGATVNPLLHISRITGSAIENIRHYLNEGDSVPVHVIDVDANRKTMAVSMLDKKADQYLDRRMSQKMKRYFGTAKEESVQVDDESELDYFDRAIRELEAALKDR